MLLALSLLALYLWTTYGSSGSSAYVISLISASAALATVTASIIARVTASRRGAFFRSLVSYLFLASAVGLLIYDTGGVTSPFIFLWPLIAVFAGLFGVWGSVPIFVATFGYFAVLVLQDSVTPDLLAPIILIVVLPITFSIITWSRAQQSSGYRSNRHMRSAADYKKRPAQITRLIEESETILNALGDGILAIDSRGVVQLINPAAQTLLGWAKGDALRLQYQSVIKLTTEQGEALPAGADPIMQSLNSNEEVRAKALQLETKSGKKLYISLVASPLGERGSGSIVVLRDITRERAEEREQAEFISTASHEMRTPVASIEGYLGLALNPSTATIDEKAREYIHKAQEAAAHLGSLFQDLLDVSKAEDGRLSNNPTVIDVVEFTGSVVEGLHQKATEKGLQLRFKPAPTGGEKGERNITPIYYANLDKSHVRELIGNLTENAIKYTPSGEVSVDVVGDNEHITISVSDTGIGIPAEDITHLFQKFYRVDNSDTREIGGTGLGLYLCRRLTEALGGRIWVESVYQKGSTFFVELPRLDNAEARRLLAQQPSPKPLQPNTPPVAPAPIPTPAPAPYTTPETPPSAPLQPSAAPASSTSTPGTQRTQVAPTAAPATPQPAYPTQSVAAAPPLQSTPEGSPQPPVYTPSLAPAPAPTPNQPFSSIEQNPAAHLAARGGTIPPPARGSYDRPK